MSVLNSNSSDELLELGIIYLSTNNEEHEMYDEFEQLQYEDTVCRPASECVSYFDPTAKRVSDDTPARQPIKLPRKKEI